MDEGSLNDCIEKLRAEINSGDPSGDSTKERLNQLLVELERKLEQPRDQAQHETLVENLREAFDQFKVEHPRATTLVNSILVSLGEAGI